MTTNSKNSADYDIFLSTLATVVATILGIFIAALSTFLALSAERGAPYSDQVIADKVAIHYQVVNLVSATESQSAWVNGHSGSLPPEYAPKFIEQSGKSGAAMVAQSAGDLIFLDAHLDSPTARTLAELQPAINGNVLGRVYQWTLEQAVDVITVRDSELPDAEVFPSSVSGPGFDQWCEDFQLTDRSIELMRQFVGASAEVDFSSWLHTLANSLSQNDNLSRVWSKSHEDLFATMSNIKSELIDIQKQRILGNRYPSTKALPHFGTVIILTMIGLAFGVVAPVAVLALKVALNVVAPAILSVISLACITSSILLVAVDLKATTENYIMLRWMLPLNDATSTVAVTKTNYSLSENATAPMQPFIDIQKSSDFGSLSSVVRDAINDYVRDAAGYNRSETDLIGAVVDDLKSQSDALGTSLPLIQYYSNSGPPQPSFVTFTTLFVAADKSDFDTFAKMLHTSSANYVAVTSPQREMLRIRLSGLTDSDRGKVERMFESEYDGFKDSGKVADFKQRKKAVIASAAHLKAVLSDALGSLAGQKSPGIYTGICAPLK